MYEQSRQGIPLDELATLLDQSARTNSDSKLELAHAKAAFWRPTEESNLVFGLVRLSQTGQPNRIETLLSPALLIEAWIPSHEFIRSLKQMKSGQPLNFLGIDVVLEANGSVEMRGSENEFTETSPCDLFVMTTNNRSPVSDWTRPLLAYTLPPYRGMEDALATWFLGQRGLGRGNSRIGQVLIAVPRRGPRLGVISLQAGLLQVRVENHKEEDALVVKAVFEGASSTLSRRSESIRDQNLTIEVPENSDSVSIWLMDSTSTILDFFSEDVYRCTRSNRVLFPAPTLGAVEQDVLRSIRQGESNRVEFKPFIRLGDRTKADEVVRTALAFANASGGDIFIGVSDLAEIDGVQTDALREYGREREKANSASFDPIGHYCKLLHKLIVECTSERIDTQIEAIAIADRQVVRVRILESQSKPILDRRSNDIFIRRGASNQRVTKADLQQIFGAPRIMPQRGLAHW